MAIKDGVEMRKEELSRDKVSEYYKKTIDRIRKEEQERGIQVLSKSEWAITIIGTASLIAFIGFFVLIGVNNG